MGIDRKRFFERYRRLFSSDLSQRQVDGYNAIFDHYEHLNLTDIRWLAYILATVYHETRTRMEPVREGFCTTDAEAIKVITRLHDRGIITHNYAVPDANGNSYFGRGLVQIAFADSYKKIGNALGISNKLYENPSLALDLHISVKIVFTSMISGLFTSYSLDDFFNDTTTDWLRARKIINGLDRAPLVADYAERFYDCLT